MKTACKYCKDGLVKIPILSMILTKKFKVVKKKSFDMCPYCWGQQKGSSK